VYSVQGEIVGQVFWTELGSGAVDELLRRQPDLVRWRKAKLRNARWGWGQRAVRPAGRIAVEFSGESILAQGCPHPAESGA
jgi:hypothetical protein